MRGFVSLRRVRSCEIASAARIVSRIVRRAVSRGPSRFGGSAAIMRKQVLVLMMIPESDSSTSFASDSPKRHSANLCNEPDPELCPVCVNEFSAELITDPPRCDYVVSVRQEPVSRQPQMVGSYAPAIVCRASTTFVGWMRSVVSLLCVFYRKGGRQSTMPLVQSLRQSRPGSPER